MRTSGKTKNGTTRPARYGISHRRTALVCLALFGQALLPGPLLAQEVPLVTLFDLSSDDAAAREIAYDVARALRKSKQVRFRDIDESLNVGGEEMQISSAKSGDGFMKAGSAKLKKGEHADAAEDLDSAVASYLAAYAHLQDPSVLPRAMALLGVALLLSGDQKGATAAFQRATRADAKLEQDFTGYPPKVQQVYDAARKTVLAAAKVDFEIETRPPYAEVYVNGRYMGLSPTYVSSVAGEQFIALSKHGYARKAKIIQVPESGQKLDETLDPARRKQAFESIKERLQEIFGGAVEPNDLTEAQGLVALPFVVVVRASGSREKMKVELALANLAGRQVVNRITKDVPWLKRDRDTIDKVMEELLKAPEVPIDKAPEIRTRSILTTWWFWAVVAGVAGGSVLAYKLASSEDPLPPTYNEGQGGLIVQF